MKIDYRAHPTCLPRPKPDIYSPLCASRVVLDHLGGRWATLLTGALSGGSRRFAELRREVGGISEKMLAQTLRQLERDGLVTRTQHATVPPRVDYELTELGRSLDALHQGVRSWAEGHVWQIVEAQQRYDEKPRASRQGSSAQPQLGS